MSGDRNPFSRGKQLLNLSLTKNKAEKQTNDHGELSIQMII